MFVSWSLWTSLKSWIRASLHMPAVCFAWLSSKSGCAEWYFIKYTPPTSKYPQKILSRLGYFQPLQKLQLWSARSIYCKTTSPRLGTGGFTLKTVDHLWRWWCSGIKKLKIRKKKIRSRSTQWFVSLFSKPTWIWKWQEPRLAVELLRESPITVEVWWKY